MCESIPSHAQSSPIRPYLPLMRGGVATPSFTTAAQSVGPCASVIWNRPVNGWSGSMVASSAVASTLALMPPYRIENSG